MPRRAKSQSISSQTSPVSPPVAIAPKPASSRRSPPASPTIANAPVTKRRGNSSALSNALSTRAPRTQLSGSGSVMARLPPVLHFPLLVLASFVLSSVVFSFVAVGTAGDLAGISKHTEAWGEVVGLLGWKGVQLAVCWFGGLDAFDTTALTVLISTPHSLLLAFFYAIRPTTLVWTLLANTVSITVPLAAMRALVQPAAPASNRTLVNRFILNDPWTTVITSLLASGIFAGVLELSFATFLPVHLITHFAGVRDLSLTHGGIEGLSKLLVALIPAGYAARVFIFVPSTGTPASTAKYAFEPATSDLRQHVYHNAWGWYSARQKELIGRTALLAVMVLGETIIQTWGTIRGVEFFGAVLYALIWAFGVGLVGTVFDWVSGPSA